MSTTLEQLLHYKVLTGVVQDPRGGLPPMALPTGYMTTTRGIPGDKMYWLEVAGTRQTAMVAQRASESQRREMQGVQERSATAMFIHEHIFHDVDTLNMLRQFDNPQMQQMGRDEVLRQSRYTRQLLDNTRAAAVMSAVLTGKIRYTIGSGIEDPGGSNGQQIDFGVPSGNQNQLDVFGNGAIIGASWATATTDIPGQVHALLEAAVKKSGYPIRNAVFGKNILGYLTTNNYTKELINGNQAFAQAFGQNTIPGGFLGIQNWISGSNAFFVDPSGSYVELVGDDEVKFLPDASPEQYELIEGTYEVPTSLGSVGQSAQQMINRFQTVRGRFNYAKITDDPAGIKHNYGDTFLPALKVPTSVFYADVTP